MRASDFWTVDQALIWLATGDADLVERAAPTNEAPLTWLTYVAASLDADDDGPKYGEHFATETLRQMLRDGEVKAFTEGETEDIPVNRRKFFTAEFHFDADTFAHLGWPNPEPNFRSRDYVERDIIAEGLQIEAAPLMAVHGSSAGAQAAHQPQVASAMASEAEFRRVIAALLDAYEADPCQPFPHQAYVDALQAKDFRALGRLRARNIRHELCAARGFSAVYGRPRKGESRR